MFDPPMTRFTSIRCRRKVDRAWKRGHPGYTPTFIEGHLESVILSIVIAFFCSSS